MRCCVDRRAPIFMRNQPCLCFWSAALDFRFVGRQRVIFNPNGVSLYGRLTIRITGSEIPFFTGTSIFSVATYPLSLNNFAPVKVAPSSKLVNPAVLAAISHASRILLPMPRRAQAG
jgi:hypothetical protein